MITTVPRSVAVRARMVLGFGPDDPEYADGVLHVDAAGIVVALGPADVVPPPTDAPVLAPAGGVLVPALIDAHVHLAFGEPSLLVARGVVGMRDLGAPRRSARQWRGAAAGATVAVAGPILTAPGGYPSESWGAGGFAAGVPDEKAARRVVHELVVDGVDVIKIALEPAGGAPVPSPAVAAAVVRAAHDAGLAVSCHALATPMVERALDAGVDELCHVPTDLLPAPLLDRVAASGIGVVSTLAPHASAGPASPVTRTAAALVQAGLPIAYGTDLGNTGTVPGASAEELTLLASAGLGTRGALLAATVGAAHCPGLRGRLSGRIELGRPVAAALLRGDPRADLGVVTDPVAVLSGAVLLPPVGVPT